MAGLGLTNAVQQFRQGYEWSQRQDEQEQQKADEAKRRAASEAASKAWSAAMTPPTIEVDGGVDDDGQPMPKITRPDPKWDRKGAIVKGLGAVADVYAANGDMKGFMTVEAQAAPLRAERRAAAIDQALAVYKADKNPINLAQAVYPHIYDGREITNAVKRDGKIEFSLSDGQKVVTTPDEMLESIQYMRDPRAAAEFEAKYRWEAAKTKLDTDGKIAVEQTKGKVDKDTADHKYSLDIGLENVRSGNKIKEIGASTAGDLKVVGARGAEDRRTADAKGESAGARKAASKIDWTQAARDSFGPQVNGVLGGTRISDDRMVALAASAREIYDANPKINEQTALLEAAKVMGIKSGSEQGR